MRTSYLHRVIVCLYLAVSVVSAASAATASKQSGTMSTSRTQRPLCTVPDPASGTQTLDVVLEGTIGIVQDSSGNLRVFFPNVPGHISPYFLALNEDILHQFNSGHYSVKTSAGADLPSPSCNTIVSPNLLTVPNSVGGQIDPNNSRYAEIQFPKPYAILTMHGDPAELKDTDPCDNSPLNNNPPAYATRVALRYVVPDFNLWLYDPSAVKTQLSIPLIGNAGTLFFGVGPEQPDDETHHHARVTFQKLQDLFPGIHRQYAAFPPASPNGKNRVRSGIDCRAPILLITTN